MKCLAFLCLIAALHAQERQPPAAPSPQVAQRMATREEAQQRLGELIAFAATADAQANAMRRELADKQIARDNRNYARNTEIDSLAEKSAAKDEAATKRIAELWKEKEADDAAWKQMSDRHSAFREKLAPWNREIELAAGSVLKGKGVLENSEGLTSVEASLGSSGLVYRWQGSAEGGKPELEVKLTFSAIPSDALSHLGNPARKIGGTGTVIIEQKNMAGVFFEKFQMSAELGHWKEGGKPPLEVAAQVIDFNALGALEVAMAGAEPSKLDRTLPPLPLEIKRPAGSPLPREEQLNALGGFLREAFELKKRIAEIDAEMRAERDRFSLRMDEAGATELSAEIDRLRRKARAGEAGAEEALAAAKAKWIALGEKEQAPLRAIEAKKTAALHEANLKNPRFTEVAAAMLAPSASLPDNVGLAKIDANLGEGTIRLNWDTPPGGHLPTVTLLVQFFHRPANFEQGNPVQAKLHDRLPVIIDAPNNARIWLQELQLDVSVSPEWQARGIKPRDLAEKLLDPPALEKLDAAITGKP